MRVHIFIRWDGSIDRSNVARLDPIKHVNRQVACTMSQTTPPKGPSKLGDPTKSLMTKAVIIRDPVHPALQKQPYRSEEGNSESLLIESFIVSKFSSTNRQLEFRKL